MNVRAANHEGTSASPGIRPLNELQSVGQNRRERVGRPWMLSYPTTCLVVDARGTPLDLRLTGANCHDSRMLAATLDAVPGVRTGRRGRPRREPDKLHADKGYDHRRCLDGSRCRRDSASYRRTAFTPSIWRSSCCSEPRSRCRN